MVAAFLVVLLLGTAARAIRGHPRFGVSPPTLVVGWAALFVAIPVLTLSATGLRRRHKWAWTAVVLELTACVVASAGFLVTIIHDPGPPGTDGAAYAGLGAVVWIATFLTFVVSLLRADTRRRFGPSPAGWYPDPNGERRWRWWDGHRWSGYTG